MLSGDGFAQVWDWNATTPDVLLGSAVLDLRSLSATRSEVEQAREEAAFQSRLAAKDSERTAKPQSATSDANSGVGALPRGASSQDHPANRQGGRRDGVDDHAATAGGSRDTLGVVTAADGSLTSAVAELAVTDSAPDFEGSIELQGPQVR